MLITSLQNHNNTKREKSQEKTTQKVLTSEKVYATIILHETSIGGDMMSIGEKLRKLRFEAGKKRSEVAESVGITESALANYENNIRIPRDEIKVRLANYYATSIENIFFAS